MDFLFHVPFSALLLLGDDWDLFLNVEFSFSQILLVVCQNCLNQLDVNKQSLMRAHCSIVTVTDATIGRRATLGRYLDATRIITRSLKNHLLDHIEKQLFVGSSSLTDDVVISLLKIASTLRRALEVFSSIYNWQ
jgi:hypothetical protein